MLVMSAFLSLTVASSFAPAYAAPPNRMTGQDWATRGYNKAAKEQKMKMKNMKMMKKQ
jgi:hypothetical protein